MWPEQAELLKHGGQVDNCVVRQRIVEALDDCGTQEDRRRTNAHSDVASRHVEVDEVTGEAALEVALRSRVERLDR